MLFEINGFDRTDLISKETVQGSASIQDPLSTFSFDLYDAGSLIALADNMPVTIWDDQTAVSQPTWGANLNQPTWNYVINQLIAAPSSTTPYGPWTTGGGISSVLLFGINNNTYGMNAVFNNTTYSSNNTAYIQQDVGVPFTGAASYIVPGQTYMLSATVKATGTISNINAFLSMQWLDGTKTALGAAVTVPFVPTSNRQTISMSSTAPANAVYCRIQAGALTSVSMSNSGTIVFIPNLTTGDCVMLEPVLFSGRVMVDGTVISYPSVGCTTSAADSVLMPDGTSTRERILFNGYIKNLVATYEGPNRTWQVTCAAIGDQIDNGPIINQVYSSTTDQAIIKNIIDTYFKSVLSYGQKQFWMPTTTVFFGQNISGVAFANKTFRDVLNTISEATGFAYFVDQYGYVHYNDIPWDYASFSVNVDSPDYATSYPPQNYSVESDASQQRNSVIVQGGQYTGNVVDTFSGNGSNKSFTLTNIPKSVVSITVGGASQSKIGITGKDTLGSNGVVVIYNPNTGVVTFNSAPASGTNNVVVTYTTDATIFVQVEDNQSIAKYSRRFYSFITDSSITDVTTAQIRGLSEIQNYSLPIPILTFDLYQFIDRGTSFFFTSNRDGYTTQPFTVQQVQMKALGNGRTLYTYTAGIYRPNMLDNLRLSQKALQSDSLSQGAYAAPPLVEELLDTAIGSDSITTSTAAAAVATYGSSLYGFSSFS